HSNSVGDTLKCTVQNMTHTQFTTDCRAVAFQRGVLPHRACRAYDDLIDVAQTRYQRICNPEFQNFAATFSCKGPKGQHCDRHYCVGLEFDFLLDHHSSSEMSF